MDVGRGPEKESREGGRGGGGKQTGQASRRLTGGSREEASTASKHACTQVSHASHKPFVRAHTTTGLQRRFEEVEMAEIGKI